VYRIVTAVFACLAPAVLCGFVFFFTRSLLWALVAGIAYTVFSPLYGLLHVVETDRGAVDLPWRLQVLLKYGEGPHTVGMTLVPLALMAVWAAGMGRRYRQIFLAAAMLALVALTHWIAALALAFCCVMMLLTVAGRGGLPGFRMKRVFLAGLLACLFACFWLTPSFIHTIAFNWPVDSYNYHLQHQQSRLLIGLAVGLLAVRLAFQRFPRQLYLCFLTLCAFGFGYIVIFYDAYRLDTIPESRRYMLEFAVFLLLALVECFRLALGNRKDPVMRYCAIGSGVILLLAGLGQMHTRFVERWTNWRTVPKEQTVEYRLAKWLADQRPVGRVLASGGLRYRLNTWFDLQQVGGTFETGLRNRTVLDYEYRIRAGLNSAPETLRMLQALGVEYVAVHGPGSEEYYRDIKNPSRFDGFLERVYTGEHDFIYRVPLQQTPPTWLGTSHFTATPPATAAAFTVPVNWDQGWVARQDGREIPVGRDQLGFLFLKPASSAPVEVEYHGTAEQKVTGVISAVAWLLAAGALFLRR
jgi:hypothetical protein